MGALKGGGAMLAKFKTTVHADDRLAGR